MPARRHIVRALYRHASSSTRACAAFGLALAAGAKVLSVVAAERLVAGDVRAAAALGVVVTALYAVRRAVGSSGQILAHCDVQRALGRATLAGDVLEAPEQDAILVMIEGGHEAARLIVDTVPEIVSDAVAFAAVAPLLARDVSSRVMGTVGVALVAIVACLIAARRLARGLDERAWTAQERAVFRAIAIVEGRLEIVTRSAERRALLALDEALALYATAARRASWATALLGRAALAAGLVAAVACAFFVAPDLLESQRAHDSILLASALPIVFGLVQAASGLARARTRTAPIVDVLARPARRDVSRGGKVPPLPAAIMARGISFAYEPAAPNVLEDVSFDWPPGRVLLLEGHNGCGKSTVLRLLLGLRAPATGTLAIGATDLATVDASALRAQVAYLPQRPWLGAPTTTVREAIALLEPDASDDVMRAALGRVGLDSLLRGDVLDAIVGELSAGQRQRLALARTLTHDAPIVLLDEPDANLDAEGAERVAAIARALAESGKMVAIAAHSAVLRTLDAVHVDLSAPRRAGSPV